MMIDEAIEKGYTYEEIKEKLNPRRAAKERRLLSKDKLTKDECDWLVRNGSKIPRDKKSNGYTSVSYTHLTLPTKRIV